LFRKRGWRIAFAKGKTRPMLTRKQHELLVYIDRHLKQTGFSPSFEEMKEALQLKSKSGIHRLISALEERGFIGRRHHRARALEVLRLPEDTTTRTAEPVAEAAVPNFSPNVIRGDFSPRIAGVRAANEVAAIELPLYGRIAAGLPIEALRDAGSQIEVPMAMLSGGEHYALEVAGDSMVEAGILDGDTVIIRKGEQAENGQIVVALVDEAAAPAWQLDRAGTVQRAARDADLPGRQGEGTRASGGADAALLTVRHE
jgi:repressor LexA